MSRYINSNCKNWIIFLVVIILWTNTSILFAEYTNYSFKHYNSNNGLSQNTVRSIFQDKQGFMWFGTKDGLNRFDGTSFNVFKFSPKSDLSDNVFLKILQDKNDDIWVSTEEGVYIYDIHKEKFYRFNRITNENDSVYGIVSEMIADNDGDIWMSVEGKGIYYYSFSTDKLLHYSIPLVKDGLKIMSMCLDNDQGVWVSPYSSPLYRINKHTGSITSFNLDDNKEILYQTGEVSDIFCNNSNFLLLGTSQKGLISINTINKTHKVLLDKDDKGNTIFVRTIEQINPNTYWIGTESGVYIYNTENNEVINLRNDNTLPSSLSDNAVHSILKDKDDGIWVGTFFGGVEYFSSQYNNFNLFYPTAGENNLKGKRIREFCKAPDNNIWIGTEDGGLNLFNPRTNSFLPLPKPLSSLYTNIHAIYSDNDYLWISNYSKGLYRYNFITGELKMYVHSNDPKSINQNSAFAMYKDRQGTLWIGTLGGLNIYNYNDDSFEHIDKLKGLSIQDIYEDSHGYLWVSTFINGIFRFNPENKEWRVFAHDPNNSESLPYNKVTSVYEDSRGGLWVTTQGGGFCYFDRKKESFKTYNSSNGLPNEVVYQIVDDEDGMLWLSTNYGLVKFDPVKESFSSYTIDNGLKTNHFNYKSSYKDTNGDIYFGSLDGFVRFNPTKFEEKDVRTPIIITDFYVNNERIAPTDKKGILEKSIMFTDELTLKYNQNSLRISYALINYSGLNDQKVYYKLDGFDKEWLSTVDKQTIIYSNLKPGKYRLLLSSVGNINNNESVKTLLINIKPPFWLNRWAFIIYFISFWVCVFILIRFYNLREHKKQILQMSAFEQLKERELYKSKINFFTNVAHEIRAPLTLIKAPLDHVLLTEDISANVKENLKIMSKNTDRLLNLTNQLLDFRKTESDAYLLNLQTHNVSDLINEIVLLYTPMAVRKNINFKKDFPESDIFVQLDKEAFIKIISNLLNNALKFCEKYVGLQAYSINDDSNEFHLILENDGDIIPREYEVEIFKPFVHIEKNVNTPGTGIGLALASSLTELHNGTLTLENSDKYNRFHLILPLGLISNISVESDKAPVNTDEIEENANKKYTILIVDDDVELLKFQKKLISVYFNVLTAEDGLQALEILKTNNVNLIVTDVMMPQMDGFELTKSIKSNIEFSHIPMILLTAKINAQSKVHGYEAGADAFLEKPFSVEVLLARINNLLNNRETLRESFLKHPFIGASTMAVTKSDEEFIKKLSEVVSENLSDSSFNVEDMAEQFNMSRASFYRKVKGVLDLSPNEFIRVDRLKRAAVLLKQGEYKVNEICYMVGFNSPSYFSKCFQQQFGVLPKDF